MANKKSSKNNSEKLGFFEVVKKIREHYLTNEIIGWLFIFIALFAFISDLDKGGCIRILF